MLQDSYDPLMKCVSKRFALKKDLPDLKQFRKFYKQYNEIQHPRFIYKCNKEAYLSQLEQDKQTFSKIRTTLFKQQSILEYEVQIKKSIKEDLQMASPQSQNTQIIEEKQKQEEIDLDYYYSLYLQQQFTQDKKQRCLEWLSEN